MAPRPLRVRVGAHGPRGGKQTPRNSWDQTCSQVWKQPRSMLPAVGDHMVATEATCPEGVQKPWEQPGRSGKGTCPPLHSPGSRPLWPRTAGFKSFLIEILRNVLQKELGH